LTSFWWIWRIN